MLQNKRELISHKIKNVRESQGISQRGLGLKAGLSGGYIAMIESNKINPSLKALEKIATALNVERKFFLEDKPGILFDEFRDHFTLEEKDFLAKQKSKPWITLVTEMEAKGIDPEKVREALQILINFTEKK